jgi:hypothetical protein
MQKLLLFLSGIGFIVPNIFTLKESFEFGNILFWTDPTRTFGALYANNIVTGFTLDLLLMVVVFFVWSNNEAKRLGMNNIYSLWVLTLLFGAAGPFPLFLYLRNKRIAELELNK